MWVLQHIKHVNATNAVSVNTVGLAIWCMPSSCRKQSNSERSLASMTFEACQFCQVRAHAGLPHRCNTMAEAPPPPLQMVATPDLPLRRSSTLRRRTMMAAPDAPIGCPSAVAPPCTFTLQAQPLTRTQQQSFCQSTSWLRCTHVCPVRLCDGAKVKGLS